MLISQNQAWGRHRSEVNDEPIATLVDLAWADDRRRNPHEVRQRRGSAEDVPRPSRRTVGAGQADQQGGDVVHVLADRPRRAGIDDGVQRRRQSVRCLVHQRHQSRAARRGRARISGRSGRSPSARRASDRIRSGRGIAGRAAQDWRKSTAGTSYGRAISWGSRASSPATAARPARVSVSWSPRLGSPPR